MIFMDILRWQNAYWRSILTWTDGVFAADMPAIVFLKAALAIGKKIPDDLAIVAYDGTYITNASTTRLTSIHQPYKEIAQEAVRQLMDMIDGPADDEQADGNIILLPVSVEKGDTTK